MSNEARGYSTIIFDFGNVMMTNDWFEGDHPYVTSLAEYYSITPQAIHDNFHKTLWPLFRIGQITEEQFWREFLRLSHAKTQDIDFAKDLWRKYQEPKENMFTLVERLKKHYRIAALSNISKEWLDFKRDKFHLENYFDPIIASGEVGVAKPDPEIYKIALKELGEKPSCCIFIDDAPKILVPAKDLGIDTVLFTNQVKLELQLKEKGISFETETRERRIFQGKENI